MFGNCYDCRSHIDLQLGRTRARHILPREGQVNFKPPLHFTSITFRRSSVPLPLLCHLLSHHHISNFINTAIRLLPSLPLLYHLNLSIARSRNKAGLSDASNIIYLHTTGAYIKRMTIIIITLYAFIVEIFITSSHCWLSLSLID